MRFEVKLRSRIIQIVLIVFLVLFPQLIGFSPYREYLLHIVNLALMYSVIAMALDFCIGYAGIFNFGQAGFVAIGAYTSALLSMNAGVSPWLGLIFGGVLAGVLSLLIGFPCLRLRGAYVGITTLAFGEIIRLTLCNWEVTRGELGLWGIPHFPTINIFNLVTLRFVTERGNIYYVILTLFLITFLVLYKILKSRIGLVCMAIREDQDATEAMGIRVTKYKLAVFFITAFFAGMAGSFYAHYLNVLTPGTIGGFRINVLVISAVLLGGLGTFYGSVAGTFFLVVLTELLRPFAESYYLIMYGMIIVLIILFRPQGLLGTVSLRPSILTKSRATPSDRSIDHLFINQDNVWMLFMRLPIV